jgi:hypothetical protein
LNAAVQEVRIAGQSGSFDVPAFEPGEATRYSGPAELRFEQASEDGEFSTVIAQVSLNPSWQRTLLVWVPAGNGRYGVVAVPDDASDFPPDHIRFVNLTPHRIGIMTSDNEQSVTLPANDWVINADGREAVFFRAVMDQPGRKAQVSNVVEMRSNVRRTVFFAVSNAAEMGGDPDGASQFLFFVLTEPASG